MKFYSGFSLKNDEHFFKEYINYSEYTVSGFSYGAIKAFKYVKEQLDLGKRVDTLQLFSPAFFQTKSVKFKRMQTMSFKKDSSSYLNLFISSSFSPYHNKYIENVEANILDLNELLSYEWIVSELLRLRNSGVKIEIYLGGKDTIIDIEGARKLFVQVSTLTYIKDANHFLQTN